MYTSKLAVVLSFAISICAAPAPIFERQATQVLSFRPYNTFQISDGVAGNALAEVNKAFPVDMSNPAAVSKNDLDILVAARQTAENAEATFNDAIDEAAGSKGGSAALEVGKAKNRVLKLRTFEMAVQIQQEQSPQAGQDKQLADIQTKLAENVKIDQQHSGDKSTSVSFTENVHP